MNIAQSTSPAISIIVPVYKAEAYLHRCVDSLLTQTFTDFEVLLIDDGSPDRSGDICDEYALRDKRVRVFHKENGGVSSARQTGIDNARGEYTIHADPDDWVEPEMLEALYAKATKEDADMVICDLYLDYTNKRIYSPKKIHETHHDILLHDLFSEKFPGGLCDKLIRRTCYQQFNIRFPLNISLGEDFAVCALLLKNNIKVAYINKAYYHYRRDINENSICKQFVKAPMTFKHTLEFIFKNFQEERYLSIKGIYLLKLSLKALGAGKFSYATFHEIFNPYKPFIKSFHQMSLPKCVFMFSLAHLQTYKLACISIEQAVRFRRRIKYNQ